MDVKVRLDGVREAMALFDPEKVRQAANQALNRAGGSARAKAADMITSQFNIRAARLSQYLRLSFRASGYRMWAQITGRGRGLALSYFDARQEGKFTIYTGRSKQRRGHLGSQYGRGRAGDVTVRVRLASGPRTVSSKYGNRPFMAQMRSGHIGVWVRKGKSRYPIEQRFGPGVGHLFGSRPIMDATKKAVNDTFGPRFKHELDQSLNILRH